MASATAFAIATAACSTAGEATSTTDTAPYAPAASSTTSTTAATTTYDFDAVSDLVGDFVAAIFDPLSGAVEEAVLTARN